MTESELDGIESRLTETLQYASTLPDLRALVAEVRTLQAENERLRQERDTVRGEARREAFAIARREEEQD